MTRPARLALGTIMLLLGLAPILTAEPAERLRYLLIASGCAAGAIANALLRRKRGVSLSWRNLANGAWLGGVVLPVVTVLLLGGSASAVGEYLGFSIALGLLIGYGVGMVVGAVILRDGPQAPK
jgi:hypothetical protein